MTPVERHGDVLVKRDDRFVFGGQAGGKVRTCLALSRGATGLVTASSRSSPQALIVATIARELGVPARLHMPWAGQATPAMRHITDELGGTIVEHRPGYNTVIIARARADAADSGWTHIPFGMEHAAAVEQTGNEFEDTIPYLAGTSRIVVPVGSGMSLAGILAGMAWNDVDLPVLGVTVGADPTRRLDRYAPANWRDRVTLAPSGVPYASRAHSTVWRGIPLDPYYEAKCVPFLQAGDLFWVVGYRGAGLAE